MSIPHQQQPTQGNPGALAAVLAYPFRIFFFSAALLATVSIPLWLALLLGKVDLPLAMPALFWHQHEMMFGFLSAAIAGFLLRYTRILFTPPGRWTPRINQRSRITNRGSSTFLVIAPSM